MIIEIWAKSKVLLKSSAYNFMFLWLQPANTNQN